MMLVDYAGGSMLTTDEIADALLRYAAALANIDRAITIDVPGITLDGLPGTFKVLLGPASQIIAEPSEVVGEVAGEGFVEKIELEIARAEQPRRALPFDSEGGPLSALEFE